MFFEAHAFGVGITSFTTNGFLDKEGYVEPQIVKTVASSLLDNLVWVILALIILAIASYCLCKRHEMRKKEHEQLLK